MSDRTVVLVIEGLAEDPVALEGMLERDDIAVVTVRSGREALEILIEQDVALAIIDVQIPEMGGFALAAQMRRVEKTRYVPIIFVTAGERDGASVIQGYASGAVDVLFKPIDDHVLRSKVDVFVTLAQQRRLVLEAERRHEMFLGILGHDLRTPLNATMLSAELALKLTHEEPLRELLDRIRGNAERMARMIEQLLDLTRLRVGGGIALSPVSADLRQLAGQAVLEFESVLTNRQGIRIEVGGNTAGTWDADRVLQIISNLVCNAVRHGSVDSPIRIIIDGTREDAVVLRVHNAGSPVPDELRKVLFEPFHRSARPREPHGLGLGLYITEQLVLAHGGSVSLETSSEAGTCFLVTMPRHCHDCGHRKQTTVNGRAAP